MMSNQNNPTTPDEEEPPSEEESTNHHGGSRGGDSREIIGVNRGFATVFLSAESQLAGQKELQAAK